MDIRATQAEGAYLAAKPALAPSGSASRTEDSAAEFAKDFAATLQKGEDTARAAMVSQADPHALVMALSQTELAVEAAATIRDKVVEAYQEILRMPV
ncbi:flagellar hook-basal body complex protein FliE [Aliiruegeria haliotis]|uniref:Flagellar hook-basal body complex protein FliE n=1 Tax=Aliiruegeria haliotis TaxID=1280846 RepID=A0A2T0RT71_9RHOB|nr:flagellar hook-basal body complex protein FliE [Aliiruegeria haliotis]PRY24395.1 flagellar hook-basal body complex protein FliE [Aliiruegeria haliotis]